MRRTPLNTLTVLSLLLAAAVRILWLRSRTAPVVVRLPGFELLATHNQLYVWSGPHTLVVWLHFTQLILILLALPLLRAALTFNKPRGGQRRAPPSATPADPY